MAGSGIGADADWQGALALALDEALRPLGGEAPDLLVLFATSHFRASYAELLGQASQVSVAREIVGCSASGVIGEDREVELQPSVSALALRLPAGASVHVVRATPEESARAEGRPGAWNRWLGLMADQCTGLVALVDPFSANVEAVVTSVTRDFPGVPLVGGLASGDPGLSQTVLFQGPEAQLDANLVLLGFSGSVILQPVVSQGAHPIGEPWTITGCEGYRLQTIGNRPAYEVLMDTIRALNETERRRVAHNLLIGLAMDEYRDEFQVGDFLIRNLLGVDPASGVIAVGGEMHVGQTMQFQVRDAEAADGELRHLLGDAARSTGANPSAALLFACNGRGVGLFGAPDHDARTTRELLGAPPLAGFFCNGEIGPVGRGTYVHGFTASLALLRPRAAL